MATSRSSSPLAPRVTAELYRSRRELPAGWRGWLLAVTVTGAAFVAVSLTPFGAALHSWMLD